MAKKPAQLPPDPAADPAGYTVIRLRAGASREVILGELEAAGLDRVQASGVVHQVIEQIRTIQQQEAVTPNAIVRALIAAGLAAVIGGALWGLIVIITDYEIGYMAIGIGALAGYATARIARAKGVPLQLIAVGAALLGILIGKYFTFFHILREYIGQEYGQAAAASVSFIDPDVIPLFFESLGELLSVYDLLWVILAIAAAWRIPKRLGIRLPSTM